MSIGLMESARTRSRDGRGMAVSVAVHAMVIGLAWFATAGAAVVHVQPPNVVFIPPYRTPDNPVTTSTSHRGGGGARHAAPVATIPDKIPPVGSLPLTIVPVVRWDSLVATSSDLGLSRGSGAATVATTHDAGGVYRTVDVMAEPDPRNPAPIYPTMLRSAGVEGSVSAQFVVDTTGRVVASSITFRDGDNAVFEQSVTRALAAARFRPALVNGRTVRVLMAQTFRFRLER